MVGRAILIPAVRRVCVWAEGARARRAVYGWGLVRMVHSRHAMFRAEVGSSCHSALMPVPARTVALSLVVFGFCLNCFWARLFSFLPASVVVLHS